MQETEFWNGCDEKKPRKSISGNTASLTYFTCPRVRRFVTDFLIPYGAPLSTLGQRLGADIETELCGCSQTPTMIWAVNDCGQGATPRGSDPLGLTTMGDYTDKNGKEHFFLGNFFPKYEELAPCIQVYYFFPFFREKFPEG